MRAPRGKLVVHLEAVPNYDYTSPDNPLRNMRERSSYVPVSGLVEASRVVRQYIEGHEMGSGNWAGGEVWDDQGKHVATVSYNGRVWEPGPRGTRTPEIDPRRFDMDRKMTASRTAGVKGWDSKFMSGREAQMLGTQYHGLTYVPYSVLSREDQALASRMYPHKGAGAKYPFVDEHYFYATDSDGRLYRGGRRVQRVLAIPYRLIMDDAYMASLGYEVAADWRGAASRTAAAGSFTVKNPIRFRPEGATAASLANARMILDAGYKLEDGYFEYDTQWGNYKTTAFFSRDEEYQEYVFKGFSIGYGGEGPHGMMEFGQIFGWKFKDENVFGRRLVEVSDPGSVKLMDL
jgi:hypothetical protein